MVSPVGVDAGYVRAKILGTSAKEVRRVRRRTWESDRISEELGGIIAVRKQVQEADQRQGEDRIL